CQAPAGGLPAPARLEIRAQPVVDLHFWVRRLAQGSEPAPELPGLEEAVQAAKALDQALGSPLAWGPIEGLLGACASAKDGRAGSRARSSSSAGWTRRRTRSTWPRNRGARSTTCARASRRRGSGARTASGATCRTR